jgi:hypothetical protein
MPRFENIESAYQEAKNNWTGLDWRERIGPTEIDLEEQTPNQLQRLVEWLAPYKSERLEDFDRVNMNYCPPNNTRNFTVSQYCKDLEAGIALLEKVQGDAAEAEATAETVMETLRAATSWEDIEDAIHSAQDVVILEASYGDAPTWRAWGESVMELQDTNPVTLIGAQDSPSIEAMRDALNKNLDMVKLFLDRKDPYLWDGAKVWKNDKAGEDEAYRAMGETEESEKNTVTFDTDRRVLLQYDGSKFVLAKY